MTIDASQLDAWRRMQQLNQSAQASLPLSGGSGGVIYDGMESRVSRLEVLAEIAKEERREHRAEFLEVQRETRAEFKAINERLNALPTKADLNSWRWQWLGMGIGIIALTVGGITGGLSLIARFVG